eukprot:TRINITY_DN149_c0_g1_i1.p1 TRINITY_DN149_c0_g1~~TRINITY_DN149_c0_g1_i1.p1  ORF type:complete len:235 (+),score=55.31 TRINITY_DN149_c0_g1_i1:180-884(+)
MESSRDEAEVRKEVLEEAEVRKEVLEEAEIQKQEQEPVQRYRGSDFASFKVSDDCTLFLHRGDITCWLVDGESDAIVNAANERLLGGGGVDGAIHKAAGKDLLKECAAIPEVAPGVRCPVGDARITGGFNLPAAYVIHTVGPVYDNYEDPAHLLSESYRNSLRLAKENGIKYIAFPAISCGVYGYPYEEAAEVSLGVIKDSTEQLKEVHFVLFEKEAWDAWLDKANSLFGVSKE